MKNRLGHPRSVTRVWNMLIFRVSELPPNVTPVDGVSPPPFAPEKKFIKDAPSTDGSRGGMRRTTGVPLQYALEKKKKRKGNAKRKRRLPEQLNFPSVNFESDTIHPRARRRAREERKGDGTSTVKYSMESSPRFSYFLLHFSLFLFF